MKKLIVLVFLMVMASSFIVSQDTITRSKELTLDSIQQTQKDQFQKTMNELMLLKFESENKLGEKKINDSLFFFTIVTLVAIFLAFIVVYYRLASTKKNILENLVSIKQQAQKEPSDIEADSNQIAILQAQLSTLTSEKSDLQKEIDKLRISTLDSKNYIQQLEQNANSQQMNTLISSPSFINLGQSAEKIVQECENALKKILDDVDILYKEKGIGETTGLMSMITNKFLSNYLAIQPQSAFIKDLSKGVVSNPNLIRHIWSFVDDQQKLRRTSQWLYEDFMRPFLSSFMIFLEECRSIGKIASGFDGEKDAFVESIEKYAKEMLILVQDMAKKELDYTIVYLPLFEPTPEKLFGQVEAKDQKKELSIYLHKKATELSNRQGIVIGIREFGIESAFGKSKTCVIVN